MLAKCANHSCSASFRHLADGRLFRSETEPRFPSPNSGETEYFWLCEACSAGTTLRLTLDGRVVATGLANTLCNCPYVALNAVDRSMGRYSAASASFPEPIPRAPKDPSPKHPVIDVENRLRRNGSRELRPYKVSLHRLASENTSIPG